MDRQKENALMKGVDGASEPRGLTSVIFFVLLLVPAVGTILFGAVDEITWVLFSFIWVIVVCLWTVDGWRRGGLLLNTSALLLPLAGLCVIGLLQILPINLLQSIDPHATYFFEIRLVILLTFFAGYLTFIQTEARLKRAVYFIVIFGAVMAFYGILQRLAAPDGIYGLRKTAQAIPFGPFVNQHHFAAFMEMTGGLTLGLLFGQKIGRDRRILLALAVVIMGAAIGFTGSRGGVLAFSAVLALVIVFRLLSPDGEQRSSRTGRLALAACGLALLMIIFSTVLFLGGNDQLLRSTGVSADSADISSGRFHFWPVALKIFLEHPLLGAGYDTFGVAFTQFDTWTGVLRVEQAHNEYLQTLADSGVAGFICILAFVGILFWQGLRVISGSRDFRKYAAMGALAGCFGVLVHSFFDFPLRTFSNSFFFLLLAAIATVPVATGHRRRRKGH